MIEAGQFITTFSAGWSPQKNGSLVRESPQNTPRLVGQDCGAASSSNIAKFPSILWLVWHWNPFEQWKKPWLVGNQTCQFHCMSFLTLYHQISYWAILGAILQGRGCKVLWWSSNELGLGVVACWAAKQNGACIECDSVVPCCPTSRWFLYSISDPYTLCHDLPVQRRWKKPKTSWRRATCSCLSEDVPNPRCLCEDSLKTFESYDGSDASLTWGTRERRARSVAVSETLICHMRIMWEVSCISGVPAVEKGRVERESFFDRIVTIFVLGSVSVSPRSLFLIQGRQRDWGPPPRFLCLKSAPLFLGWAEGMVTHRQDWKISTEKQLQAADNMKASKVNRTSLVVQVSWQQDGFAGVSGEIWRKCRCALTANYDFVRRMHEALANMLSPQTFVLHLAQTFPDFDRGAQPFWQQGCWSAWPVSEG